MSLQLSSFHNSFQAMEDPEMDYSLPPRSSIVAENRVKYYPSNKSTFNAGDKIEFRIDDDAFSRLSEHVVSFRASLTGANGSFPRNIGQLFQDIKIMTGSGQKLEYIQDYDILVQIEDDEENQSAWSGSKQILEGCAPVEVGITSSEGDTDNPSNTLNAVQSQLGSEDDRNSKSQGDRRYCIKLKGGIMNNPVLFPLSHAGLRVEMTLSPIARSCTTTNGGTAPTALQLSEVCMLLANVKLDSKFVEGFNARYRDSGVPLYYSTIESNSHNNLAAGTNRLRLSENISSLRAVKSAQILTTKLTDSDAESQVRTSGGVENFQFKWGGEYCPRQPVITGNGNVQDGSDVERGVEAYVEYMRCIRGLKGDSAGSPSISADEWYGGAANNIGGEKFVIASLFNKSPEKDAVSGAKTKNSPLDLIVTYKTTASTPADLTMYSFLYKDSVATLSAQGDLVEE